MSDAIDLQTTVQDKAPTRPSFGVPMIVGFHTAWPDRAREYEEAADMLDDGFTAASPEYQKALIIKQQQPSPPRFKVGRLEAATFTHTVRLTPTDTTTGRVYDGEINDVAFAWTVPASDAIEDVCDDAVTNIDAISGVTVTDSTTHVDVVADAANTIIPYKGITRYLAKEDITDVVGTDLAADLAAILDEDSDWYGLTMTVNSASAIEAASAWVEANKRIYVPMSSDTDIVDAGVTDDIASDLVALSLTRTALIWHRDIGGSEWADAGFLAVNLAPDPGSYTPAYKSIVGVSTDVLRPGERTALKAKNCTRYMREHGFNVTYEGRTPSGRFFDVTRFIDWLDYTIEADLFALLVNNPKVFYDADGLSLASDTIKISLIKGQRAGGIATDTPIVVTVPDISETSQADRANRIVRDIKYTARLSGALHGFVIRGTVSV